MVEAPLDIEPDGSTSGIHLLDVGTEDYGDSLLVVAKGRRILIDGGHRSDFGGSAGHPSIPDQLRALTGERKPRIDLLVATHTHLDHIGCLPELVANTIEVEWALLADPDLGWGQSVGQDDALATDARIVAAVSGLREEPPTRPDSMDVAAFLADAADLRTRYRTMIDTLIGRGTRVVRHGIDSPSALLAALASLDLEVLGPTRTQLALCAAGIHQGLADAIEEADRLLTVDAGVDAVGLFRSLRPMATSDAIDASRPGALVNNQSTLLALSVSGRRSYFGGDMQLAKFQVSDPDLRTEMMKLRETIRAKGPFGFAKLGHHGSDNAQDPTVLADWGSPRLVGITLGSGSADHPNATVLGMLAAQPGLTWARTDRNGQSTFRRTQATWTVTPSRGALNDATPNQADPRPTVPTTPALASASVATISAAAAGGEAVEVNIRVPEGVDQIRLDLEVIRSAPRPATAPVSVSPERGSDPATIDLHIGGGRVLPPLLYVTGAERLAHNVGAAEARTCIDRLRGQPGEVLELTGGALMDVRAAERAVQARLVTNAALRGVVLVGGYDVVPSHRYDTLPASLATRVGRGEDLDRFYVWTDDLYGRPSGPKAARPVSRVPDGKSASTLFGALSAGGVTNPTSRGVRNSRRPFADGVYAPLPARAPILISEPSDAQAVGIIASDYAYVMLHGNDQDASRFWGDGALGPVEAINLLSVAAGGASPRVALFGACWGALPVDTAAQYWTTGGPLPPRLAGNSIAVRFVARGASVVGCTGCHYSPGSGAPNTMGEPMHRAFWAGILGGLSPAEALHRAKIDYVAAMPHGLANPTLQSLENKMLWQFTCLGLGW